jgi:hypothetical protein
VVKVDDLWSGWVTGWYAESPGCRKEARTGQAVRGSLLGRRSKLRGSR